MTARIHDFTDGETLYIDGAFEGGPERVDAMSPSTGERLGAVTQGTVDDVERAVVAAAGAAKTLATMSGAERAEVLLRVADAILAHREELGLLVAREQGKPLASEALPEVDEAAECFRVWAEEGRRLEGELLPSAERGKRIFVVRRPRGVYAVVTPWNWPLTMPAELLAPALAAGNAVVWVAAPSTSLCAAALARCIDEGLRPAGLCGAVNLVTGAGAVVGDAAVAHPGTHGVAFIGSTVTGRKIAARAAGKPLLLELGGNGPIIVCADADLERAAKACAVGAFLCAGQSCSAAERILVDARVHDRFVEALVAEARARVLGDPLDPSTTLGPLNNAAVADKTARHVDDARARGARVLCGGRRAPDRPTPLFYEATVVDGVGPGMAVFDEETFGPVAPIATFSGDDELWRLADAGDYGLVAAVFTKDLARAFALSERVRAGVVNVNETTNYWELHVPFGGVRGSGTGRIGGKHSLHAMTDEKTLIVDVT